MDRLTKDEVRHVADLARLSLSEFEEEKYARELYLLLEEINKIQEINVEEDPMIAPYTNDCALREDIGVNKEDAKSLIENAPNNSLNFIEVAGVFDE